MGGSAHPLRCCDSDCAGVNHCCIGGYQCERCGLYFCGEEIDEDGLCPNCHRDPVDCQRCVHLGEIVGDTAHCNKLNIDFGVDAFEDDCDDFEEREDS